MSITTKRVWGAIRRRCSAYRRRTNTYAKSVPGLQRALTVQRLIHLLCRYQKKLGKQQILFGEHA